jgi:5-methylcytosine-specific restriction endonuclease McrA
MNGLYDLLPGRPDFDESKYRLGSLCRRKHDWMKTGQSLRHASNNHCPQCDKERYQANLEENQRSARERMQSLRMAKIQFMSPRELQEYRKSESEHVQQYYRAKGRKSRAKGMESFVIPPHLVGTCITADELQPFIAAGWDINQLDPAMVTESRDAWRQTQQAIQGLSPSPSVARLVMDEQKRYWRENPDAYKEHRRQWDQSKWWLEYQTRPELRLYIRQKSKRRKALLREQTAHQIQPHELRTRFALFGNCCAYCGASGDMEIEHVIPISKGGTHAMGNILPACHDCNSSKRAKEVEGWYRRKPFFTEIRWRKICRALGWNRSGIGQLALL